MSESSLDAIPKTYEAAVDALAAAHGGDDIEIYSWPIRRGRWSA